MRTRTSVPSVDRTDPAAWALVALLALLWLAGGASRADALGQVVVRASAWLALLMMVLAAPRPNLSAIGPAAAFLVAILALPLLQLVPLPPGIWATLPGRQPVEALSSVDAFAAASAWRPWTMVPGATWNAAGSLVVPAAILILVAGLTPDHRRWLPTLLLGLVTLSAFMGLLQFSGAKLNNMFINDTPGDVSGNFANRNHFALFLAMGCVLAPAWAFLDGRRPQWRGPVAVALVLLFVMTILATGSRAGIMLGVLALAMGLLLVQHALRRELRRYPRWVMPVLLTAIVATIAGGVVLSIVADRATAIDRAFAIEGSTDMRARALPVLWSMIRAYFPAGGGFGGFDPLFRIHETPDLLKPTYFNHAHNDFLEIVLDGGIAGLALLIVAAGWWAVASIGLWRRGGDGIEGRLGSAMLLLAFVASAFDYPVRTPMMMATVAIAAAWLAMASRASRTSPLPADVQQL